MTFDLSTAKTVFDISTARPDGEESAFQEIPVISVLFEFAAAANKTNLETIDFFGRDAINQILEKTGTDFRVLRAGEQLDTSGGFMDPGLGSVRL